MRVLLDEMLPIGLRALLPDHDVATAAYVGLAGVSKQANRSRSGEDADRRQRLSAIVEALVAP